MVIRLSVDEYSRIILTTMKVIAACVCILCITVVDDSLEVVHIVVLVVVYIIVLKFVVCMWVPSVLPLVSGCLNSNEITQPTLLTWLLLFILLLLSTLLFKCCFTCYLLY